MAPALARAGTAPKAAVLHAEGRTRFSTPEHVWKKKDWAEQELAQAARRDYDWAAGKTAYVARASSRKSVRGGEKSTSCMLAEQVALRRPPSARRTR